MENKIEETITLLTQAKEALDKNRTMQALNTLQKANITLTGLLVRLKIEEDKGKL